MGSHPGPRGLTDRTGATSVRRSRCIALVGPYLSGKTTLLEAILARTGAITRQGTIADKNTTGDASPEARSHGMSVDLNIADVAFLDDTFTFIDCPGSVEFQLESTAALAVCDAAVVVCEPDEKRVAALQLILKSLEDRGIPHVVFLNKIDTFSARVRDILPLLQPASRTPLVLRQIPIWQDGVATGFVDLASERAFVYRPHAASEVIALPADLRAREHDARFHMLEQMADHDDDLMEQLLSDTLPPKDRVFDDLAREMRDGLICPVFLGSAANGNGIVRLLKALRHEAPFVEQTARRLKLENATSAAHVIKTIHTPHGGKMSVVRVLTGSFGDGTVLRGTGSDERVSGVFSLIGETVRKRGPALPGDTVGFGRLEKIVTGETLTIEKHGAVQASPLIKPTPVYGQAIVLRDRKDEVKLSAALAKLVEEDPSLILQHAAATHQIVLWGQGEMHLRVTLERLRRKYGIEAHPQKREVPYKETIRIATEVRGRHKKQSGGHGQFGDVLIAIEPLSRGEGFRFDQKIHGGTVPKQYIPSVEIGVADYLTRGPLGFPVVDIGVTLLDGSYHAVDSSDMAFRQAGRLAMSEGLPKCQPVLLEPIMRVDIAVPSDATARVNAIIAQRRGQILGFDARAGWSGWDLVEAHLPESEMTDLIIELRSATAGVGTYTARFQHLAELTGRLAEQVITAHAPERRSADA
jgi:elongation factor G